MQKGTNTLSDNNMGNASPLGLHNPLFHDWNGPKKARIQDN